MEVEPDGTGARAAGAAAAEGAATSSVPAASPAEASRTGRSGRPPVVLVPGAIGQRFLYWNVLAYRLRRDGHAPVGVTFPRFTLSDLRVSADLLARRVEDARRSSGSRRVTLVCHSMGGLVARWYVRFLDGADRVERMVFLATPHKGTVAGLTGLPFRGARQVLPGSPFLNRLNEADDLSGIPCTNVYSLTDLVIVPQTSARLELANVENRQVTLAGHWGMLVSRAVYTHVRHGLDGGEAG